MYSLFVLAPSFDKEEFKLELEMCFKLGEKKKLTGERRKTQEFNEPKVDQDI